MEVEQTASLLHIFSSLCPHASPHIRPAACPAFRYDVEAIVPIPASRLIELVLGAQPIEAVTVELPSVKQRRADLGYRMPDGSLHQFELQSDNDDVMDARMLEYYALYWRQNRQPPVQHVLYIGQAQLNLILSGLRKAEKIVEKEAQNMAFEMTIENNSYLRKLYEAEKREEKRGEGAVRSAA